MKSLNELSAQEVSRVKGVVFDLDGTLLTDGQLGLDAYCALHEMADAGLELIVCTGRPAAWGEVVQRQWPVALTVTENGAVSYRSNNGHVARMDRYAPDERGRRRARLLTIVEQLRAQFPNATFADDNLGRLTDITIDIGERESVDADTVRNIRAAAHRLGARTFVSSIHLHVTIDTDDKATGTLRAMAAMNRDASSVLATYAFVGDSANDESCFAAFRLSFGVANIKPHLAEMTMGPRFVSTAECGEGFAEIAARLLALREPA
jgi:HAD superfamily hydrolase (TIGR01484 family)